MVCKTSLFFPQDKLIIHPTEFKQTRQFDISLVEAWENLEIVKDALGIVP
jgi:hypothetical protein